MRYSTILKKSSFRDIIWLYKVISKKSKIKLLKLVVLMIFCAIAELISISAVVPFLALLINKNQISDFYFVQYLMNLIKIDNPIIGAGLILIISNIITPFLRLYNLKKGGLITAEIGSELSYLLYKINLNQPYSEYIKFNSSTLISAANLDIGRIVLILSSLNNVITSFFISLFIIVNLIFINSSIALSSLVIFGICYVFIGNLTKQRLNKNSKVVADSSLKQVSLIQEIFGSIKEVLLYQYQDIYLKEYLKVDKPMRKLGAENIFLSSFPKFILESAGLIFITLIAIWQSSRNVDSSSLFPLLGIFAISAQRLLPSFQQIFIGWSTINANQANLKRVKKLINKKTLEFNKFKNIKKLDFQKNLVFKNVFFSYKKNNYIFSDLNFNINKGEKIGLIGNTGAGKSTLINMIMGFLYPNHGQIFVDNNLINATSKIELLKKWQKNIAYVPQNIYLKDSSFIENIAFGINKENIDLQRVFEVSTKAEIKKFIDKTEKGFFTKVGERGILLSGGQAQRIAISRALYRKSNFLILDEATSALDNITEEKIINSIFSLGNDLTLIMIAHRLTTLRFCDRIFIIQKNNLEEISYQDITKFTNKII